METETRTTDSRGRVTLKAAFANATVIVEYASDSEVLVRKAAVVSEAEQATEGRCRETGKAG